MFNMADSNLYYQASQAYKHFLFSVLQEVSHHRQMMFECLSEHEQNKVLWFLHNQSKGVEGSILQNIAKPPQGSYNYACIPKITEVEYIDYIDKRYKNKIIENCMRHQEYNNDEIKSRVVSEIVDVERKRFYIMLGRI